MKDKTYSFIIAAALMITPVFSSNSEEGYRPMPTTRVTVEVALPVSGKPGPNGAYITSVPMVDPRGKSHTMSLSWLPAGTPGRYSMSVACAEAKSCDIKGSHISIKWPQGLANEVKLDLRMFQQQDDTFDIRLVEQNGRPST